MRGARKKSEKAHLVVGKDAQSEPSPDKKDDQGPNKQHKEDFEQLLDDALGTGDADYNRRNGRRG